MNQITKKPLLFQGLSQLQHAIDRMLEPSWFERENWLSNVVTSNWVPTIDIKDEQNQYIIKADVPGVDPKNIDVSIEKGIITIKGYKEIEQTEEHDNYIHIERSQGSFYRSFNLPNAADASKVSAKSKNGVLEIVVPKIKESVSQKIHVQKE